MVVTWTGATGMLEVVDELVHSPHCDGVVVTSQGVVVCCETGLTGVNAVVEVVKVVHTSHGVALVVVVVGVVIG